MVGGYIKGCVEGRQRSVSFLSFFACRERPLLAENGSGSCGREEKKTGLSGLLIFRGKKSKISRDFQGQIRGKIGRFRGIFAGKKIKIRGTIGRFQAIFAGEKSKFAGKSAHFEGF